MIDTFLNLKKEAQNLGLIKAIVKFQPIPEEQLRQKTAQIAKTMIQTIKDGISSNSPSLSGLCGCNTEFLNKMPNSPLVSPLVKKTMVYAAATIEQNARMGKIAACPTAGSSGIVPSVLVAAYEEFSKSFDDLINSLIVSGEIGRIISLKMQLAGAVAGCQAECGVASAMASSGLGFLLGDDIDVIFNAAALNLKNMMGLTCDPVAGLVEIPCVKRNILLCAHAINSLYVAESGIKSLIPIDEVVDAMREVGMLMSPKLKESAEAGLAVTKTGVEIKNKLYKIWHDSN